MEEKMNQLRTEMHKVSFITLFYLKNIEKNN